jgi:hypothetical protein
LRHLFFILALAACGVDEPVDRREVELLPAPASGFQLTSPEIEIPPGTEATTCVYFTVPLDEAAGVKRWESAMTPGSHHLTVYFTPNQLEWDGTIVPHCKAYDDIARIPAWAYSAQKPRAEFIMPEGIGMTVPARQHGFIQMHYINPTESPLKVRVAVNAHTYGPAEGYTPASAFVTYATKIDIPGGIGQESAVESGCEVPEGAKFLALTTHSHRRTMATWIQDGETPVYASTDWEHPEVLRFAAPSFHSFASGKLRYGCAYRNDLEQPVRAGSSAETDEMCMAVGYFFPATRSILCIDQLALSL